MSYSVIVFDTAPTGHTLRLLQFPTTLEKGLSKLMGLRGMFGGLMDQVANMMGASMAGREGLLGRLEDLKVRIDCASEKKYLLYPLWVATILPLATKINSWIMQHINSL